MPYNARSSNYEIELPIKGADRGTVRCKPAPGTCPDCRNVRSWDLRDRLGVGKRSGSVAAFSDRAGSVDGRRVTLLAPMRLSLAGDSDIGGYSESISDDFSGFTVADPADFLGNYVVIQRAAASATNSVPADWPRIVSGPPNYCQLDGDTNYIFVVVNYRTSSDVTASFTGHTDSATFPNFARNYCVMVRGEDTLDDYIFAHLVDTGVNTWAIRFSRQQGASLTTLGTSSNFSITEGDASESAFTLRVTASASELGATLTWPTKSITHTYALANTDFIANTRAGFGIGPGGTSDGRCNSFTYTRLVPGSKTLVRSILGTDTESPLSGFLLKTGWTSAQLTTAGVLTTAVGPADEAAAQDYPLIDDANDFINVDAAPGAGGTARTNFLTPTTAPASDEGHAIEMRYRNISTNVDDQHPVFKISDDFLNGLKIVLTGTGRSATTNAAKQMTFYSATAWQLLFIVNGALTGSLSGVINSPIYVETYTRWEDTGTTIRAIHNGMTIVEIPYTTDGAYAAAQASLTGTRVGVEFGETASTGGGFGFRVVDLAETAAGLSNYTDRVLVLTKDGGVKTGRLDDTTSLTDITGFGSGQQLPSVFDFAQKWYMVDGTNNKIIDPALGTSEDWATAVTEGTFPSGCRLACLYRGRAVVARSDANPSIWYMSRVLDPLDWDFGAAPTATSAVAGTNADVGQPGDVITALIAFSDDYLIFGCAGSIWMLEGDPGYQGAIQNVSYQTGIVGPRAWCFDEQGNLFFIGNGGLYRMDRGTRDPVNVSNHRLAQFLDRVDLATTLVQLVYDHAKGTVHIFLTAVDLSGSIHAAYDVRRDAFWFDTLPVNSDPFSGCSIHGAEDEDRRIIWGGNDGYIRRWDDDTASDHDTDYPTNGSSDTANETTTAYLAFVRFAPIEHTDAFRNIMLTALQFQGDSSAGTLSWYLLTGDSAEEVNDKTITLSNAFRNGTVFGATTGFSGGHQQVIRVRARAGVHQLVIFQASTTDSFSIERIVAMFAPTGDRR
jgi:hypothetical protein